MEDRVADLGEVGRWAVDAVDVQRVATGGHRELRRDDHRGQQAGSIVSYVSSYQI